MQSAAYDSSSGAGLLQFAQRVLDHFDAGGIQKDSAGTGKSGQSRTMSVGLYVRQRGLCSSYMISALVIPQSRSSRSVMAAS
ncbi:hypothetical protein [Bradyrhizobium centrosematis]|uniref:hypothetical protein n=1 Tax=Bradyrhizobium centrosematis TaxID=1300039 RepID=UPI00389105D2